MRCGLLGKGDQTHIAIELVKLLVRNTLSQSVLLLDEAVPEGHGAGV